MKEEVNMRLLRIIITIITTDKEDVMLIMGRLPMVLAYQCPKMVAFVGNNECHQSMQRL
jgi:hypothetical protein